MLFAEWKNNFLSLIYLKLKLKYLSFSATNLFFPKVINVSCTYIQLLMRLLLKKYLFPMKRMKKVKLLKSKSLNSQKVTPRSFAESRPEFLFPLKSMIPLFKWEDSLLEMREEPLLAVKY